MADDEESAEQSEPPQLVVQQFSMEALHHIMMENNCQILGMYDEMSVMYGQLDAYKHSGSRLDRSTLLDLYNGGSWSRNFRNKDQGMVKMQQTAFNMCGFIQPAFILGMLDSSDPDAFNDRQFFICPEEVEFMYADLKVPMDPTVGSLEDIFRRIKHAHQEIVVYKFDAAAQIAFIKAHDELCRRKIATPDDEDRRGILSKARGQLARMAMIIHSLEQAVANPMPKHCQNDDLTPESDSWEVTIKESSVVQAEMIMNYVIEQKFALMKEEVKITSIPAESNINTGREILDNNPKYLSKFLTFKSVDIQPSDVSQFRLMPPKPSSSTGVKQKNKYPVEQCKHFMKEVSEAGFGTLQEIQRGGSLRKGVAFRKRLYNELGDDQIETLKKLKINEELYNNSPTSSLNDTSTSNNTTFSFGGGSDDDPLPHSPATGRTITLCTPDSQK